jgi:3-phosphoshikimate 1-carboxyvinyltransferase
LVAGGVLSGSRRARRKDRAGGAEPKFLLGDRAAEQLFRAFGARVEWQGSVLTVSPNQLNGMEIDAAQIPDLVPVLAATAALCKGKTRIFNAQRLKIKESDRLKAMAEGLTRLGGKVSQTDDGLLIEGVEALQGGEADGYNDHRIVMALAIAAIKAQDCVTVTDAQSIRKSYPDFLKDYNTLGGKANVVDLG